MDTLFDYIEHNNWDGFEHQLKNSAPTPNMILSLAEHALKHNRAHMLEDLLDCVNLHSESMSPQQSRSYMERTVTLAIKAMRFENHECFTVVFDRLNTLGRYECLRDCVVCQRENFLRTITSNIDPKQCWRALEHTTHRTTSNMLDHLLDVCPVPSDTDIATFEAYAPFITDTAMEVVNLGWNHCLERILNLTPKEYDATEICVVACENENWEGARIALQFTTEDKVRAFNISFDPQMTQKNVGMFLCMLEDERLHATLTNELSNTHAYNARRKL